MSRSESICRPPARGYSWARHRPLSPRWAELPLQPCISRAGCFRGSGLFVIALALVWGTYFSVMYQVFRITAPRSLEEQSLRLVPRLSLIVVVLLGILMVLMVITGPYSHFHVPP